MTATRARREEMTMAEEAAMVVGLCSLQLGEIRHVVEHRQAGVMIPTVCQEARVLVERTLLLAKLLREDSAYVPSGILLRSVGASLPALCVVTDMYLIRGSVAA